MSLAADASPLPPAAKPRVATFKRDKERAASEDAPQCSPCGTALRWWPSVLRNNLADEAELWAIACSIVGVLLATFGPLAGTLRPEGLMGFLLMATSGFLFVVFSTIMSAIPCLRRTGALLVSRTTLLSRNWSTETLRSFAEMGAWLHALFRVYAITEGDFVMAVVVGAVTGCCVCVVGDRCTRLARIAQSGMREVLKLDDFKGILPTPDVILNCVILLFCSVMCHLSDASDIWLAMFSTLLAGASFILAGQIFITWTPTRRWGRVLQGRVVQVGHNWRVYPVRSALELTSWMATIFYSMVASGGNMYIGVLAGSFAGAGICLVSDYLFCSWPGCKSSLQSQREDAASSSSSSSDDDDDEEEDVEKDERSPFLFFVATSSYALIYLYHVIFKIFSFDKVQHIHGDSLSPLFFGLRPRNWVGLFAVVLAGIAFIIAGQLLVLWHPTQRVGRILQNRVINAKSNWVNRPGRSAFEIVVWVSVIVGSVATHGLLTQAVGHGTMVSIVVALCNDLVAAPETFSLTATSTSTSTSTSTDGTDTDTDASQKKSRRKPKRVVRRKEPVTWAEVQEHRHPHNAWLVIHNKVYDVSSWADRHPGGSVILKFAGADATDQYDAFHLPRVNIRLRQFLVGDVVDAPPPLPATLDFRRLRDQLAESGAFEPDLSYFATKQAVAFAFFAVAVAAATGSFGHGVAARAVLCGLSLGMFWHQSGFLAHDALHNGVFDAVKGGGLNMYGGFLGTVCFGISSAKWLEEHNLHHAITIRANEDPQFKYLPLWLIDPQELSGPHAWPLDWTTRVLVSVQAYTLLPLAVLLGRINLYLLSIGFALSTAWNSAQARLDLVGFLAYWGWLLTLMYQLPTSQERWIMMCLSHWVVGILHIQLLINHLAFDSHTEAEERKAQFYAFQLKTTRNIDDSWWNRWLHGGLQYQIEHHLFPRLPRHELHKAKPAVMAICKKHGLPYESVGFIAAVRLCLKDFARLARELASGNILE